jgi:hypothetical protein
MERQIGTVGTVARVVLGPLLLVLGALGGRIVFVNGLSSLRLDVPALAVGLVVYPLIFLVALWIRSLRDPNPLLATGPRETALNLVLIVVLTSTQAITPISFIGFGVFVFYGATMLLAAALGYAGCEVSAVSNWLLRRQDQIGCPVLTPLDALDRRPTITKGNP